MSRVAREVGVSTAALYWHFDSKAHLACGFLEDGLVRLVDALESAVADDDPCEQLVQFVRTYLAVELARGADVPAEDTLHRHGYDQALESIDAAAADHIRRLYRRPYELLCEILEAGAKAGVFRFEDRAVTAQVILTMVDFAFTWYRPEGRFDVVQVAEIHAAIAARVVDARGTCREAFAQGNHTA